MLGLKFQVSSGVSFSHPVVIQEEKPQVRLTTVFV